MDIILSFSAKTLDKHGITLVHITYPPLLFHNNCSFIFRTTKACITPVKEKSLGSFSVVAGFPFTYTIPNKTFVDATDGDARSLSLTLERLDNAVSTGCWYNFNSISQTFSGLPALSITGNKEFAEVRYRINATNSCGKQVSDTLKLLVRKEGFHCFELNIEFKTSRKYSCEYEAVEAFAKKLAGYYELPQGMKDIKILKYIRKADDSFQVTLTFSRSFFSCNQCSTTTLIVLASKMWNTTNFNVNPTFNSFLSPSFTATSVSVLGLNNQCGIFAVAQTGSEDVGETSTLAWAIPLGIAGGGLSVTLLAYIIKKAVPSG